jgi:hypothetical protein
MSGSFGRGRHTLHRMPDDYGAPVSRGAMQAIYIGGILAVGL